MKYPDFNVSAEGPNGSYVRGKGGGNFKPQTPTPANQNGNIIQIKRVPKTLGEHVLGKRGR